MSMIISVSPTTREWNRCYAAVVGMHLRWRIPMWILLEYSKTHQIYRQQARMNEHWQFYRFWRILFLLFLFYFYLILSFWLKMDYRTLTCQYELLFSNSSTKERKVFKSKWKTCEHFHYLRWSESSMQFCIFLRYSEYSSNEAVRYSIYGSLLNEFFNYVPCDLEHLLLDFNTLPNERRFPQFRGCDFRWEISTLRRSHLSCETSRHLRQSLAFEAERVRSNAAEHSQLVWWFHNLPDPQMRFWVFRVVYADFGESTERNDGWIGCLTALIVSRFLGPSYDSFSLTRRIQRDNNHMIQCPSR